jgi:tetratricopeptide (TPR) repeat protein
MLSARTLLFFVLVFFMLILPGLGQSGKPIIIRDTDIAEGIDEEQAREKKVQNPDEAKKNIDIGNFYYKRKNYVGAILRYLTAIEYQPDSDKAYKSLVRAHKSIVKAYDSIDRTPESIGKAEEKHGRIAVAIDACTDFLSVYPDWIKSDELKNMITKLEEASSRFDNP